MATETKTSFIEYLPPVFRQDEVAGENFLRDFLSAFESVFQEIQQELDAIPDLFVLLVPRSLQADAPEGTDVLELDTAAGLCVGDVLHLQDSEPARVEFAVVRVAAELGGTKLALADDLRFGHLQGTPVSVARAPVTRTVLTTTPTTLSTEPSLSVLSVENIAALDAEVGDVLLIGDQEVEFVQVDSVFPGQQQVKVVPLLRKSYLPGTPVQRTRRSFGTMPPPAFLNARERNRLFLAWMAGWIGLRLRQDLLRPEGLSDTEWEQYQFEWNRRFIEEVIPAVPWRGTQLGLQIFLNAFLHGQGKVNKEGNATVVDTPDPLQLGLVSTVGVDTVLCGASPYFFWVNITAEPTRRDLRSWGRVDFLVVPPFATPRPAADRLPQPGGLNAWVQAVQKVVSEEKPAHTRYALRLNAQTMQVGQYSTIGEDTLLWTTPIIIQQDQG